MTCFVVWSVTEAKSGYITQRIMVSDGSIAPSSVGVELQSLIGVELNHWNRID